MKVVVTLLTAIGVCLAAFGAAQAQPYPNRPVRLIVPYPAAGGYDVIARTIGARLSAEWGQQVIVDNRAGAEGNIGTDAAAKATPDGYTISMGGLPTHAINPALYRKLPYDPVKDFAPVTLIGSVPVVLMANPQFPAKTVNEFIAYAKANPGKVSYGSAGSAPRLAMELLRSITGIDVVHIPYKGSVPAATDLIGGQVAVMFDNIQAHLPSIKSGRIRALGVGSAKHVAVLPDVPTLQEAGIPFEATIWYAVFAPARASQPILDKLNADIVKVLNTPEVQQKLTDMGLNVTPSTPAQLAALVKSESARWGKVVRETGLSAD